jgi:glycosyltransferase involved in cell wall biosynthesis
VSKSATVIIATTGARILEDALLSVTTQDHKDTRCWVVIDGPQFVAQTLAITERFPNVGIMALPENTGANGFYGHRIYAAASFLVNSDYIMYLDQDNWMAPTHVSTQINNCETNGLDWGYSLRSIWDKHGNYLLDDNCESLGNWPIYLSDQHHLVDTSCYCIRREVITRIGGAWYGGWGGDRQFFAAISQYFPKYGTTGKHTLCYRLDGNTGSVNQDFFVQGNAAMEKRYPGGFPWKS